MIPFPQMKVILVASQMTQYVQAPVFLVSQLITWNLIQTAGRMRLTTNIIKKIFSLQLKNPGELLKWKAHNTAIWNVIHRSTHTPLQERQKEDTHVVTSC